MYHKSKIEDWTDERAAELFREFGELATLCGGHPAGIRSRVLAMMSDTLDGQPWSVLARFNGMVSRWHVRASALCRASRRNLRS